MFSRFSWPKLYEVGEQLEGELWNGGAVNVKTSTRTVSVLFPGPIRLGAPSGLEEQPTPWMGGALRLSLLMPNWASSAWSACWWCGVPWTSQASALAANGK